MITIVAPEAKTAVLEKVDFSKINQENTELFYKTLYCPKNIFLLISSMRHGLHKIDVTNPACITFLKIHLVFCTHLRLWGLVLRLLEQGYPYISRANTIFLVHEALANDQERILQLLLHRNSHYLRDKDLALMKDYFIKKAAF